MQRISFFSPIKRLSLSLFEALRGLREAVAPTTTEPADDGNNATNNNTNTNTNNNNTLNAATNDTNPKGRNALHPDADPDYDDFLIAYYNDEEWALELTSAAGIAGGKAPKTREEYVKLRAKLEMTKHSELVPKLAQTILKTSAQVEELVGGLPGMERSREEQMVRIQSLLEENLLVEKQLKDTYVLAESRRDEVKSKLRDVTCHALGIEEDN